MERNLTQDIQKRKQPQQKSHKRKRFLSCALAAVLALTAAFPTGPLPQTAIKAYAAADAAGQTNTLSPAYFWNFETVNSKTVKNSGTVTDGDATLNGTAAITEEVLSIGNKSYSTSGNHVLKLQGGTKKALMSSSRRIYTREFPKVQA